jgi:hypothetical protein
MTPIRSVALSAAFALAIASAAFAGGDDYDGPRDTENNGPSFFGFVRDTRGAPVSDARVVLRPKTGDAVEIKTNVLGLYRSHVRKEIRPDEVEVSCDKAGYKQTGVNRRPAAAQAASVETNCTLQRL